MKIQSKITSLLSLIVVVFILFAFYQFNNQNNSFTVLLEDTKKQQAVLLDKLLEVEGKNIEVFVQDYTFWDQMVSFISSKDERFAKENIDTGAETFNADTVEVYNTKHVLVYAVEGDGVVIPPEVFTQLDTDRFIHFFMNVEGKVVEMRGATVHPTDDVERKTTPRGYFFAGRVLDSDYITTLAGITESSIEINLTQARGFDTIDTTRGHISFVHSLAGFDDIPVGYLHVEKTFFGISQFYAAFLKQFWVFSGFLLVLILFAYVFLNRFVARPLSTLSQSIRDQNTKPIEGMKEEKSEFGDLAGLVLRFSEKIDTAKTDFVALVSHQLRTPLTIIGWYMERLQKLLTKQGWVDAKSDEYISGIFEANKRMVELVNATVEISRIESGHVTLKVTQVDLIRVIDEVSRELAPIILKKQISFNKKYDADLPRPMLDERLVFIIVQNLLSNALKYTDMHGSVTVAVLNQGSGVQISVIDSGIGISSLEQGKIFEKLFRTENARAKDPEGSGLGLYISKALTKTLGGTIEFTSNPDKGTTFVVHLPLSIPKQG